VADSGVDSAAAVTGMHLIAALAACGGWTAPKPSTARPSARGRRLCFRDRQGVGVGAGVDGGVPVGSGDAGGEVRGSGVTVDVGEGVDAGAGAPGPAVK